ncbi:MAG: hypothetical protein ACXVQU_02275 [Actinomycetota bacterium]
MTPFVTVSVTVFVMVFDASPTAPARVEPASSTADSVWSTAEVAASVRASTVWDTAADGSAVSVTVVAVSTVDPIASVAVATVVETGVESRGSACAAAPAERTTPHAADATKARRSASRRAGARADAWSGVAWCRPTGRFARGEAPSLPRE